MKVLIDARVISGRIGGVEQFLIGLAHTLKYASRDFHFYWLVFEDHTEWIAKHLSKNSQLVSIRRKHISTIQSLIKKIFPKFFRLIKTWLKGKLFKFNLPEEFAVVRALNPDVIHFTQQVGFKTHRPNVYHPHDLQHKHFPKFFSTYDLQVRDYCYSEMARQATVITVGNEWTMKDFAAHYPEYESKLLNVPISPQSFQEDQLKTLDTTQFGSYFLYPAALWPHKNHRKLLLAFSSLNNKFRNVKLVLTGPKTDSDHGLAREIKKQNLEDSVIGLGFVTSGDLAALYKSAVGVVIPTLFESASYPIWEAFSFSKAVAASNVTSIPNQVNSAALLFNPESIEDIYSSMEKILVNVDLRKSLELKGKARFEEFTYINSAQGFEFAYRCAAGNTTNQEDQNWLRNRVIF
jgi:glycosyltransferase involved in cell wall biosynthesis